MCVQVPWGYCCCCWSAKLALDRAPRYQAEIKEWVHARIGYHIAFAQRVAGVSLVWAGIVFRSAGIALQGRPTRAGARRRRALRAGCMAAGAQRQTAGGRIELDQPVVSITRTGPDKFALASEIELGGGDSKLPTIRLNDLPAGTLAIRGGLVTIDNWNPSLPRLELHDVNLRIRRGTSVATLGLALKLPDVLGGDVTANGAAQGAGPLNTLNWTALGRTQNLSLAGWRQLLPEYLSDWMAGPADSRWLRAGPALLWRARIWISMPRTSPRSWSTNPT
jgi:hypothetical protein